MKSITVAMLVFVAVALLSSCSTKEEKPAVSEHSTTRVVSVVEYEIQRGDRLEVVLRSEVSASAGDFYCLSGYTGWDGFAMRGNSRPNTAYLFNFSRILEEINPSNDFRRQGWLMDRKWRVGQRVNLPDLNRDGKINGREANRVGELKLVGKHKEVDDRYADSFEVYKAVSFNGGPEKEMP